MRVVYVLLMLFVILSTIPVVDVNNSEFITVASENKYEPLHCVASISDTGGSIGSGYQVKYGSDVYVVTAAHVLKDKKSIYSSECSSESRSGQYMKSSITDTAIIKVDNSTKYIYEFGKNPEVGDKVQYIGYKGDKRIVGDGVVVSESTDLIEDIGSFEIEVENKSKLYNGVSGGPIIDKEGKVVGHISSKKGDILIGIQSNYVKSSIVSMTLSNSSYKLPSLPFDISENSIEKEGLIATESYKGIVDRPRLRERGEEMKYGYGDVITHVNGRRVESVKELKEYFVLTNKIPGERVRLKIKTEDGTKIESVRLIP